MIMDAAAPEGLEYTNMPYIIIVVVLLLVIVTIIGLLIKGKKK